MPCSRQAYTPSATPAATTELPSTIPDMKYASSPACPPPARSTDRAPAFSLSGCGRAAAPARKRSGASRLRSVLSDEAAGVLPGLRSETATASAAPAVEEETVAGRRCTARGKAPPPLSLQPSQRRQGNVTVAPVAGLVTRTESKNQPSVNGSLRPPPPAPASSCSSLSLTRSERSWPSECGSVTVSRVVAPDLKPADRG
jgi:hypothetical protein